MWLNQTTAPTETPISLDEAKAHLRVLHANDDATITALIAVATEKLDGRRGYLGRALLTQSWEYRLHFFPVCGVIEIPLPPLQSVESVKYIDDAGAEQTLATDQYVVDTATHVGQIRLGYGLSWPSTRWEDYAVRIRFTAGFGDAADDVPQPIRQAILLMIGHWYVNRTDVSEANLSETPMASKYLLGAYRMLTV
jgi:uncharacterized phiE125 gp8 family phage protein